MDTLLAIVAGLLDRLRKPVGLLLPPFADPTDFRGWPWPVRAVVHLALLAAVIGGLYLLAFITEPQLHSLNPPWLKKAYLPFVFVCVYMFCWIVVGLRAALRGADEFPDITAAWEQSVQELTDGGFDVRTLPLYLVVGRTDAGDDALLSDASGLHLARTLPGSPPVRVYAGRDGLFVVCPGASGWAAFTALLREAEYETNLNLDAQIPDIPVGTIRPDEALNALGKHAKAEFRNLLRLQTERALSVNEQERLNELLGFLNQGGASRSGQMRVSPPRLSADQASLGHRRLTHLCNLIRRDRQPWCPVNGCLVLVPWRVVSGPEISREAVGVLAADLAAARTAFQLRYPHIVLVCDLELADGFDEFKKGFPKEMLRQRIGQRLPLVPDCSANDVPRIHATAADTIRANVLASWVFKFLRLDWSPDARKTSSFVPSYNRRLFQFLVGITTRGPGLTEVLATGLPADPEPALGDPLDLLPLCGGCYLAATGTDERNQAFVPGVFQRLAEGQSLVSWSPAAVETDRRQRNLARLLLLLAGGLFALAGVLIARALR